MTNIMFMYDNLFDSATLTESSEIADAEAENTQHPFLTKVWTTSGGGTENLVIDYGSAKAVTAVAIAGYNWTSAPGTLDLELHTADAWGGPDNTEALTWSANPDSNSNPGVIIKKFSSITKRYNRLNVVYATGDFSIGRMFIGTYFEPSKHFRLEQSETIIDPSYKEKAVGGASHSDKITKYRERTVRFITVVHAQYQAFQALINSRGFTDPMFVAFDYDNFPNEQTMYCELVSYSQTKKDIFYELTLTFRELVE